MVVALNTGVVKLLPVDRAVPPVASAYHLMVAFGSLLVAVMVVEVLGHRAEPGALTVGALGAGDTVTVAAVRDVDAQPLVLTAST